MLHIRTIALPVALAILGASAAPAFAGSADRDVSQQHLCLWDEDCNPRAVQPRLAAIRWNGLEPAAVRAFTRMDVEALRLFQRMP